MKKLIMSLVLVGACQSTTKVVSSPAPIARVGKNQVGAPDAVSAVRAFLAAAKEPDLQAMGVLFGDAHGPARDVLPREELEKREVIMARCLRHDRYAIVGDAPNPGGGRNFVVSLVFRDLTRSSNFEVVMGPSNRWYVQKFDPGALNDICAHRI
jgi:hypothetical protein